MKDLKLPAREGNSIPVYRTQEEFDAALKARGLPTLTQVLAINAKVAKPEGRPAPSPRYARQIAETVPRAEGNPQPRL